MDTALDRLRDAWHAAGLIWQDGAGDTATAQAPGHSPADRSVSFTYTGEKILMKCHAGEDTFDVLQEVGLDWSALAEYADYTYPDGRIKHRRPGKKIWQTGNTSGTALYRVDDLPEGKDTPVYVVEGEKDVHALEYVGAHAVTSGGANTAHKFDWTPIRGRDIIIVADNDEPGRKHAVQVAQLLDGHARSITTVTAKTGKDAADHIDAGHTLDQFQPLDLAPTGRRLKVTFGHDVKTRKVEWLIPDWIPKSALTLLAGREGLGKSTIAVAWAAEQTRQGHTILYVHTEDSREHTVAPRLKAAGADMSKVLFVDVETETSDSGTITLPFDNGALEKIVQQYKVTFMVLDAATSSMSSELSGKDDRQVRQFLEPLAQMAARQNMVVLGLVHFGKRDGADSGKLILGSIAWSQVARSVLSVALDNENEHLVLTNTKGNLATGVRSEALKIASQTVDTEDGPTEVGRVEWLGATDQDARELLSETNSPEDRGELTEVESWLEDYLTMSGGSAMSSDVKAEAAKLKYALRTIQRARKKIGVVDISEGFPRQTRWSLPGDATGTTGTTDPHAQKHGTTGTTVADLHKQNGTTGAETQSRHTPVNGTTDARREVLGALSANFGMDARTLAGSVSKPHRDQVPDILDAFVAEGIATVDGTKYVRTTNEEEIAA